MNRAPRWLKRAAFWLLIAALVASRYWSTLVPPSAPIPPGAMAPTAAPTASPTAITRPTVGFRDADHLAEHFRKHGSEFGASSAADYLRLALALRDAPTGGPILEAIRSDGTITRFDRNSGAFLAFDRDGVIRTFFRPNDGEAYFRRQLSREPNHS